jgi:hypothetical protein
MPVTELISTLQSEHLTSIGGRFMVEFSIGFYDKGFLLVRSKTEKCAR